MHDVVIVGCGPAGVAAAIQLKRSGVEPLVIERQRVGGLLVNAHLVENYPGFCEGLPGVDLAARMEQHLSRLSIRVLVEEVMAVDPGDGFYTVETDHRRLPCKVLVVASGTKPRTIPSLTISDTVDDSVLYEIHPIRNVSGKRIAIVGAGDAAFDYAMSLEARNEVVILNRGHRRGCLDLLWQRAEASSRISYREAAEVERVSGEGGENLVVGCRVAGRPVELQADYLVLAIGREPELGFLSERFLTSIPALKREGSLHLIGDVRGGSMRQTAIAVGDGVEAAMMIHRKLQESEA
jgi:thioredoxin reductase